MSVVAVKNVVVQENPAPFCSPFRLHIFFQCYRELPDEINWRLIYIASPRDESCDQVLDEFSMGQLKPGSLQFTLESNSPDWRKISKEDLLGVTAIILSVSYRKQEFFRVGFYINNYYEDRELQENEPEEVVITKVVRNILTDKPRVFPFEINWDKPVYQPQPVAVEDDPFVRSNGAFDMFGPASQIPQF